MAAVTTFPSHFNPSMIASSTNFIVTALNGGPSLGGHSFIVVEGVQGGERFIGQYDIQADVTQPEQISSIVAALPGPLQTVFLNRQGSIREVRVYESASHGRNYSTMTHTSWPVPATAATAMIGKIKLQKWVIEALAEDGIPSPFPYQENGAHTFIQGNAGENCATWTRKMLEEAGINPGWHPLNKVAALPVKPAGGLSVTQAIAVFAAIAAGVFGLMRRYR